MITKYLYNHTSEETAYNVDDYPWGFRLRTQIRYWVETREKFGQRFCAQTRNPKTGKWCKPKKSTYGDIVIMCLNEDEHVKFTGLDLNHADEENVAEFKEVHGENLTEYQVERLRYMLAYHRAMKNVTFEFKPSSVGPVSLLSDDPEEKRKIALLVEEQERNKRDQAESLKQINRAIAYEYAKAE